MFCFLILLILMLTPWWLLQLTHLVQGIRTTSVLVNLFWPFSMWIRILAPYKSELMLHFGSIMCWCLHRHNKPSDLHSESEKGNTSERDSFLDSDAKESSQFGSLTSYLPSVEPSPPHNVSQPYAVSADDATSTHYQASLQSHLPIQSQSTGPLPPILAQPDPSLLSGTQPTSDSSQLPYPVQDSSGGSSAHEVCDCSSSVFT